MNLERLQANWDQLGTEDPFWAILSDPRMKGNRWDVGEFFQTGQRQVDAWMKQVGVHAESPRREKALDFGCGAGRLTQALCDHFDSVCGVDIAPSMIDLAQRCNRHGDRCEYVLNGRPDLSLFDSASFDFICSHIVLQHIEPQFAETYLREFIRLLRPGGFLVFKLPARPSKTLKGALMRILSLRRAQPILNVYRRVRDGTSAVAEMYGIDEARVVKILTDCGATVHAVESNQKAGKTWTSYQYLASRPAAVERLTPGAVS